MKKMEESGLSRTMIVDVRSLAEDELRTCRICLKLNLQSCTSIFDQLANDKLCIDQVIALVSSLKISRTNEGPKGICKYCLCEVQRAYAFRKQCWESELILRQKTTFNGINAKIHQTKLEDSHRKPSPVVIYPKTNVEHYSIAPIEVNEASIPQFRIIKKPITVKLKPEDFYAELPPLVDKINRPLNPPLQVVQSNPTQSDQNALPLYNIVNTRPVEPTPINYIIQSQLLQTANVTSDIVTSQVTNEVIELDIKPPKIELSPLDLKPSSVTACVVDGNVAFKCSTCGYTNASQWLVVDHANIHGDVRKFKCDQCPYTTNTSQGLYSHRRIHPCDKPVFSCYVCSDVLTSSESLAQHVASHVERIGLGCDFKTSGLQHARPMRQHKDTHNPNRKYKCADCAFATGSRLSMFSHKMKHMKALRSCPKSRKVEYD